MTDRASLKRKLDAVDKEQRDLRESLWRIETELEHHRLMEMQLFLKRRCPRIAKFSNSSPRSFDFDNDLVVNIDVMCNTLHVYDGVDRLAAFDTSFGIRLNDYPFMEWDDGSSRLTRLVDVLPELDRLVHVHLPAWVEVSSKELDVESLVMSRTLRWVAAQLGGSTQWPDIVSGNFPI